jgi:hypothetical protein
MVIILDEHCYCNILKSESPIDIGELDLSLTDRLSKLDEIISLEWRFASDHVEN